MTSSARAAIVALLLACQPASPGGATGSTTEETTAGTITAGPTTTTTTTIDPTIDPPVTTTTTTTTEPAVPVCGDGVVAGDEACDDGNQIDDDCCTNACTKGQVEPGQVCWTVIVEGTKNGEDLAGGIAVDAAGEIYIAASVVDMAAGPDALIQNSTPEGSASGRSSTTAESTPPTRRSGWPPSRPGSWSRSVGRRSRRGSRGCSG
ncbi:DUF4215 domain-containing protein [Nannocystis pusilla]|uniref:DUF4215 domain-containing protein n=1 Tax=Nannocystis pusilla TaxID=889268 RepID=A0A9X3J372_9BACT|nr:DUF4215 domain-containing protein [Nannocystis pusilla]MCY1012910.1 DUF4215 domain-containing protein [Nannocystis pusilla]